VGRCDRHGPGSGCRGWWPRGSYGDTLVSGWSWGFRPDPDPFLEAEIQRPFLDFIGNKASPCGLALDPPKTVGDNPRSDRLVTSSDPTLSPVVPDEKIGLDVGGDEDGVGSRGGDKPVEHC